MPFKKGQSGNIKGRTKGSPNRTTKQLRENINSFLNNNFQRLENDFELLPPRDRIKFYCDLLQYGLPKLQSVELESDFEHLTDMQIDKIINELKSNLIE
jgi:predicted component of type VI protein secretion system